MVEPAHPAQAIETERQILRLLMTRQIEALEWVEIGRKLRGYTWREADHAVIYEAILRIRNRGANNSHEALAIETTRMGFPDLDWNAFFRTDSAGGPALTLLQLIERL